jgi:hypothetical protein
MKFSPKTLLNLAGWGVALIFLGIFWQQLGSQQDWQQVYQAYRLEYAVLGVLLLIMGFVPLAQMGVLASADLQYPLTRRASYHYWALSQMAKYLPGGIWFAAAKAVLYARSGMPLIMATAATVWELLAFIVVALALSLFSIPLLGNVNYAYLLTLGAVACFMGMWVSLLDTPWRILAGVRFPGAAKMLTLLQTLAQRRWWLLIKLALMAALVWVFISGGFYCLLLAAGAAQVSLGYATVSFAVAWMIGFLVFITPSGLGPREAMLTLLLTPAYGAETAFALALLARVWWAAAESTHILITLVWLGIERPPQPTPPPRNP